MKYLSFFVFLNALIHFSYAQAPTTPAPTISTCEQKFSLQGTTCTPCQQTIFKYDPSPTTALDNRQPPSDKCLIIEDFDAHFVESSAPSAPSQNFSTTAKLALDKTCADTANNACSESYVKSIYTEVDKTCDAELNQYFPVKGTDKELDPPYNIGLEAEAIILLYYNAIPLRGVFCDKTGDDYCLIKFVEKLNQTYQTDQPDQTGQTGQTAGILNPFINATCNDDCTKKYFNDFKTFTDSHPLNTPNLQKILGDSLKQQQDFGNKCNLSKSSNGRKLMNEITNYPRIILIGIISFIYVIFI